MARDTKLSDDLAALAEEERQRLGERPGVEQLVALRKGELTEERAERIRDRLAVDPELASIYLDLKRGADRGSSSVDAAERNDSEAEVDAAWRKLLPRLVRVGRAADDPAYEAGEVVPFPRKSWARVAGLAASMIVAAGLLWLLATRQGPSSQIEDGYHVVTDEQYRDARVPVPAGAAGLALDIDVSDLAPGPVWLELLDASNEVVWSEPTVIEPGQRRVIFGVASSHLVGGKTYQVVVRSSEASPGIQVMVFRPVFGQENSGGRSRSGDRGSLKAAGACVDLDAGLSRAIELRFAGQRRSAKEIYQEVLATARDRGCRLQEARAANGLGVVATQEWQLYESLAHFDAAAAALAASGAAEAPGVDSIELQRTLEFNRGVSYFRLGWLVDARDAFDRARTLDRRLGLGGQSQANLLLQTARILRLQGEPREAGDALGEALGLLESEAPPLRASLWQEQARLDLEAERFETARESLDRAIEALAEFADPSAKANVFADVAELAARRGRWVDSLEWVDKALSLAPVETPDFNLETHARYVQSVALHGLGDLAGAKRAADGGLALLESLRGVWRDQGLQFFALRQKHYRHRLELAEVAEEPEAAWKVFEAYRARGLLESTGIKSRPPAAEPPHAHEIERQRRELLEAVRQLDRLDPAAQEEMRARHQIVFRTRRRQHRELQAQLLLSAGLRPPPAVVDSPAAVAMLDDQTLALVFLGGSRRSHVLALDRRHGLEGKTLGVGRERLEALSAGVLEGLRPESRGAARDRLEESIAELSRLLLGPVADRLSGFLRLAIVVEDPLEGLPFEVLRHPGTDRPLIESHEIAYLPSFSVLGALRGRSGKCVSPASDLLALGDPVFGARDRRWPVAVPDPRSADEALAFRRLAATASEVRGIAELYPEPQVVLASEANRELLLTEAPLHRIVHVATHARSDRQVPERSKIALSCVDAGLRVVETCDLYFADVVTLDLCGQIIVLSACETAGGRRLAGEGILGLPRAFLRAGASTVVASLWRVADEPTSELMIAFHRLLRDGEGPAAALRKAKLELIGSGQPPSAWAPFVLLGDWRNAGPP